MASSSRHLLFSFLVVLCLINITSSSATTTLPSAENLGSSGGQGSVGRRTEIKNVRINKKVQRLGLFSVAEHNLNCTSNGDPGRLSFIRVVAAEYQVVAGVKYFLKVAAKGNRGTVRNFDAIVLVQPWLKSKKLLSFLRSYHH